MWWWLLWLSPLFLPAFGVAWAIHDHRADARRHDAIVARHQAERASNEFFKAMDDDELEYFCGLYELSGLRLPYEATFRMERIVAARKQIEAEEKAGDICWSDVVYELEGGTIIKSFKPTPRDYSEVT